MDDENGRQKVQRDVRVVKQRGQRHYRDVIHESCSYMNAVTGVEDDKVNRPPNETSGSHQTEVYSSQSESSDDISVLAVRESRQHHGDAIYENRLNMNDKPKNRLMKMSANPQKWSTKMYSLEQAPKEPDKEKRQAQKRAQVTEPIAIDVWTLYSGCTSPEVQEAK
jgi:hypothetical protein